jgi:PPM family protein phosphatase
MNIHAGNAQHIGARKEQQDSFGFSDPSVKHAVDHGGFVGVVADGMGGLSHGQEASSIAVRSFLAAYQAKTPGESVVDALTRSLMEANRAVVSMLGAGSAAQGGTTLAAAALLDEKVYWISAGDSRIYWLHGNELTRLTADHVYATKLNREVALGRSSWEAARNHPERGSLTSYLGQPEPALIDRNLKPLILHDNESIVLCSDGFYRGLSDGEITSHFSADPQHACASLVELVLAKDRKQQDNLTVIAFKAGDSKHWFARLSGPTLVSLLVALCSVLLLGAGGYLWFAGSLFSRTAAPAAKHEGASRPVTVSTKPSAPAPSKPLTPSPSSEIQRGAPAATPVPARAGRAGKVSSAKHGHEPSTGQKAARPPAEAAPAQQPPAPAADSATPPAQQETKPPDSPPAPAPTPVPAGPSTPADPAPQPPPPPEAVPPRSAGGLATAARAMAEILETDPYAV